MQLPAFDNLIVMSEKFFFAIKIASNVEIFLLFLSQFDSSEDEQLRRVFKDWSEGT